MLIVLFVVLFVVEMTERRFHLIQGTSLQNDKNVAADSKGDIPWNPVEQEKNNINEENN